MKAEVIIIGDELLNGRVQDINGSFIGKSLFEIGISVEHICLVQDEKNSIQDALKSAWARSEIVFITGGLGPTEDDRTKAILADYFGKDLLESSDAIEIVKSHYSRIDKDWNPEANHYHFIPDGFEPIENPKGTAPGLFYQEDQKVIFCAPGVPKELKAMLLERFIPILKDKFQLSASLQQQVVIRTKRVPEEKIFNEIVPTLWKELEKFGKVSSLPHIMGVDIIVTFSGDQNLKNEIQKKVINLLRPTPLFDSIWQFGNDSLPEFILKRARKKNLKISIAESCTGGLTSSRLTDIAGCSDVFVGGAVTYSNEAKVNILNVKKETLESFGAVSSEVAKEMAEGAIKTFNTDVAVSFTGIAGPTGGSKEKPVGLVGIGIASKNKSMSKTYQFYGDRESLKLRFSEKGMFSLLSLIEEV